MKKVVSLFSGAGGADLGFHQEGFTTVLANDVNPIAKKTFEANLECWVYPYGIAHITEKMLEAAGIQDIDVVLGGPPCPSFSSGRTTDRRFNCSGLNLLNEMKRLVALIQPKIVICENAPTLLRGQVMRMALDDFATWPGYTTSIYLLNTEDYGIPQERRRTFVCSVRQDLGKMFRKPPERHWKALTSGWAEFLGYDTENVLVRKSNSSACREWNQAAYTVTGHLNIAVRKRVSALQCDNNSAILRKVLDIRQTYLDSYELAKLQGFPSDFGFAGNTAERILQIGNAWSVPVARALAKEAKNVLGYVSSHISS